MSRRHARSDNLPAFRADPAEAPPVPIASRTSDPPAQVHVDLVAAFLAGRSPRTLDAYRRDLDDFARFLGLPTAGAAADLLTAGTAGAANALALGYKADMVRRELASATVARRLAALRSMVKLARTLGRISWTLEIKSPRVETYTETAGPGDAGWRAVLDRAKADAGSRKPKAVRDLAIVRLLHDLALRRADVVELDLSDLDLETGTVSILGKGRTARERLTLPDPVRRDLGRWVAIRGTEPGPLFKPLDPGADPNGRLLGRGVHKIIRNLGRRAGLARPLRPHGLRHQGITKALDVSGGNVREVQRFSRHRKIDVLLRYDDARRDVAGEVARRVSED